MGTAEALYDEAGKLEIQKLRTLSRSYAQAIAGVPRRMSFDPQSGKFELEFNATLLNAPTVIYLNEDLHYPNGYSIAVSPKDRFQLRAERNILYLHLTAGVSPPWTFAHVQIDARAPHETVAEVVV